MTVAKLVEQRSHSVPGKLRVAELFFDVPLDYNKPDQETIRIFCRGAEKLENPVVVDSKDQKQLPWFVNLTGGPGFPCRPPQEYSWMNTFLDRGYKVLLLDQRGMGLSTPITAATLAQKGNAVKQAEYAKLFRADNAVRDCEAIRKCLTADYPEEKKKWSIIGQSYGGFMTVTYLSKFPEGLREAFTCGGLPPMVKGPDPVYERTYAKVKERNEAYYTKFPEDVDAVKRILKYLNENRVKTTTGGNLSPSRFMHMGLLLGFHGGLDNIHDIVLRASTDLELFGFFTRPALSAIDGILALDDHVIYSILHEPLYCQGEAPKWSADRLRQKLPDFDINSESKVYFTGEMIYKNMFDDYEELRPLKEVASLLAEADDWPDLYDEAQLAKNEVPVYSATYVHDMYVDIDFALETAKKIKGLKHYITNVWYHDAMRSKADELMKQLFALRDDTVD